MAVAMRTNGLHHAISLGNIEIPSKETSVLHYEKCYDSDDDNMSRHRLRTSSSSELYPKTSVYSKGDIREQYCLTDRQLNSIERPRRERLFGCLSGRSAPQSFLGVCVGRRAPSDENLAAYAPFYKYPRYQHHHQRDEKVHETDLESSYFRRQPASILSTAKMPDTAIGNRFSWTDSHATTTSQEDAVCANDQRVRCSLYPAENFYQDLCIINPFNREQHLISNPANCLYGYATHNIMPAVAQPPGPSTPRTKHVSFARSHTLTSFDDVNLGLRSSGRMKTAQSQERLIGGKKPIIASGSIYEPVHVLTNAANSQILSDGTQMSATQHQNILQHPQMHGHQHGHGHAHQHHHGTSFHVHQIVPVYHQDLEPQTFDLRHNEMPENFIGMGIGGINIPCPTRSLAPRSPEIVLVEKKFRNAMKTQATQTELRKDGTKHSMEASPSTVYKVKVVSQGAQTNGLINGKKLTKSLSEMPNDTTMKEHNGERASYSLKMSLGDHDSLHRTQSEEPPRSPKQIFAKPIQGNQINLMYYSPPAPPPAMQALLRRNSRIPSADSTQSYSIDDKMHPTSSAQSITTHSEIKCDEMNQTFVSYEDSSANYDDSYGMNPFDYESNSLPRRACSYHRLDNDLYSHSLPRRDPIYPIETCRHITDCTELLGDTNITDYSRQHLLPPPRQYRKDTEDSLSFSTSHQLIEPQSANRRMSMVVSMHNMEDTPFKRDDIRRQSMPVPARTQKLADGYVNLNKPEKTKPAFDSPDEKEIFIDFKPHISTIDTTKKQQQQKHRKVQKSISDGEILTVAQHKKPEDDSVSNVSVESSMIADAESECDEEGEEDEEEEKEDPLYENVQCYNMMMSESDKRDRFRKRSISLEDAGTKMENANVKSAPPSPCQDELLVNASTYPSSDSLANDLTRDHSDGIWNESQVTVLTAETKDLNETEHWNSNLLLTPSSKRKNLILQHQQRSSIDTDALDFEDQFTDHSPTFSNISTKAPSTPTRNNTPQPKSREFNTTLSVPMSIATPIIAVTPTAYTTNELELRTVKKSPSNSRRSSKSLSPIMQDVRKMEQTPSQVFQHKNAETQNSGNYWNFRSEAGKNNADLSECSTNTNTDEYVTCTDTSKRTPGIKTPPTTTSSSSTTQVPVSAQSSQTEKTHGGSSFESASSLYSSRGDVIFDDITQVEEKLNKLKSETGSTLVLTDVATQETKLSPAHSISSTSSGSYNMKGIKITSPSKTSRDAMAQTTSTALLIITPPLTKEAGVSTLQRSTATKKTESISDDERSDKRYSSSGYYESPHDEEHTIAGKFRRHRVEEDRKRRRTIMKLDIEKENIRALTSPIKKLEAQSAVPAHKEQSPEKQLITSSLEATTSPSKMKRFRPKIRRQFRRSSRDGENTPRRQKNQGMLHGLPAPANTEKLLDVSVAETVPKSAEVDNILHDRLSPTGRVQSCSPIEALAKPLASSTTPNADSYQLKAKSVESLRSVSPGSDSVFYSEADGTAGNDPHSHCLHCGKEMEAANAKAAGDSVESLQGIENDMEQDIVKPPSDFADSPVATKTTQRLYKKMDKRFRSEERYNTERGRHYKSRQENIRAKSEERGSREKCTRSPQTLRPSGSSPCVLPDASNEQRNQIIYRGHYDHGRYSRLTDADVWMQLDHQSFDRQRDRRASTESEKSFHAKYQVILHRLVQRRCTLEMYHRQKNNNFSIDKTVVVKSDSGEFGFRIHGSKPVVVAAIEPDTPAECSGLEVGDIIISVNGVQVLDKHHTEVVKIAHAGCDTLELEVARTIGVLMSEQQEPPSKPLFSGYLWRQSGQAKGTPNTKKWVRRWFCLRPDHCLYYYKTEEDTQPVGAMIMAKHTVDQCSQDIGKPFAFKIDSGEGIPMYVAADSEELAKQWMNTLKHSAVQADPWLEKCARTLSMPPSGILRPDCFGYLMKLGSRWCGWSKRYCVLKDACLYFYQDANSKNSFGMACLQGYKVASMSTNASGRKNSFEIIPTEPKLRHYYFSTESEMDKKRWISALEYSIDRWIKSG